MSDRPGALAGVRVISFGAFVAGNTAAKLLAELGADVVKIESRARPEVLRTPAYAFGPAVTEPSGVPNTVMYATLARGPRNLAIDLSVPEARPLFHRMVSCADVVVENFAGPTLEKWGCGYEELLRDNPRLVMLSLSGYGLTGPRAGYLGYASTISSYLGLSHAWDYTHGTYTDYVTAATGVLATLAALARVRDTGTPCRVDVGQIDAMAPLLAEIYLTPLNDGGNEARQVNRVAGSWFSGIFRATGDDAWLALDIEDGEDWSTLCQVIGRPDLVVASVEAAGGLEAPLREAIGNWASARSAYTAMHVLQKAGLAAGVVQSSEDVWRDAQLHVRGFREVVDQPDLGPVTYPRSAQRWSATPGGLHVAPARLGEHTFEVLDEWLSVGGSELGALAEGGAIFNA